MIQNAKIAMRKEAAQSRFYRVWGSQRCCWCVSVRLAVCPGKGGKPSVLITKTFEIYLGNPTDDEMLVQSCDIIGFYTGTFEIKTIKSTLETERNEVSVSSLKNLHIFFKIGEFLQEAT